MFISLENFLQFDDDIKSIWAHVSNAYDNNSVLKVRFLRENTTSINRNIHLIQSPINRLKRLIQNVEKYVLNTKKDGRRIKVLDRLKTIKRRINVENVNNLEDPVEDLNRNVLILCGCCIKELDRDFYESLEYVESQL